MAFAHKQINPLSDVETLEFGDAGNALTIKVYGQSENRDTESVLMVTINMGVDPDPQADYSTDPNSTVRFMRPGDRFVWGPGDFTAGVPHDIRIRNRGNRPLVIEAYDS